MATRSDFCLGWLLPGQEELTKVNLLIELTKIDSDDVIEALELMIVKGMNPTVIDATGLISQSNALRAAETLAKVAGIVEQLKDVSWKERSTERPLNVDHLHLTYLVPGKVKIDELELLLDLTSIRSDKIIKSLVRYLVNDCPLKTIVKTEKVTNGNFHKALSTLDKVSVTVEKIKNFDWSRFRTESV